jgi:tetratricopeptide (TPR) repeat protein
MVISYPQRRQFTETIARHFKTIGWAVNHRVSDYLDFEIRSNNLRYMIRCFDDMAIRFRSSDYLLDEMDRNGNFLLRTRNQVRLTILEHNFFGIELRSLERRNIFAITCDEINIVSDLIAFSSNPPKGLSAYQMELLDRNVEYGHSISEYFRKQGDYEQALKWAKIAVSASFVIAEAHLHLFNLFVEIKRYDEARAIGNILSEHRSLDPRVAKAMLNFAIQTEDASGLEYWKRKLSDNNSQVTTFETLLENQRISSGSDLTMSGQTNSTAATGRIIANFAKLLGYKSR